MKGLRLKINIIEKKINNNIIIDNKKNLLRINSISNKIIDFKILGYSKPEKVNFFNMKEGINNDLNTFDYFFLIRTEEEYNEELDKLKVCYHYYLYPSNYFKIKEDFCFLNRVSFSGKNWLLRNFKDFCFKYDLDSLISFKICSPYISY